MARRIVVFGISGVGKTSACKAYVAEHPEFLHLSAGELIRQETSLSEEQLRTASAPEILAHQRLLGDALERRLAGRDNDFIIEAHSLIDNGQETVPVSVQTVRSVRPTGLILLEATPKEIEKRRRSDGRNRPARSQAELALQIKAARELVEGYSKSLRVPMAAAMTNEDFKLDSLIDALP